MTVTSKITEFRVAKGVTIGPSDKEEIWRKKSLELTVKLPEGYTEIDFQTALDQAEYILDTWLGTGATTAAAATPQIPNFNPEELMKHTGWKTKKNPDGSYTEVTLATLSWAWDFIKDREGKPKFSKEVLAVLTKGLITIDKYTFSFNVERGLINVKKKKESAR